MRLLISLLFISCVSVASASTSSVNDLKNDTQVTIDYAGPGKKKARKGKRINKRRKRACGKWAKRSYAG